MLNIDLAFKRLGSFAASSRFLRRAARNEEKNDAAARENC